MLADAVSKPALPTLTGAPPSVEKRALEQCLLALVRMNEEYRQRTIDKTRAVRASWWAWIMLSLLLRRPSARPGSEQDRRADANPVSDLSLTKLLKRRVQFAETGQWDVLLSEYLCDRSEHEQREKSHIEADSAQPCDDDDRIFERVVAMVHDV